MPKYHFYYVSPIALVIIVNSIISIYLFKYYLLCIKTKVLNSFIKFEKFNDITYYWWNGNVRSSNCS